MAPVIVSSRDRGPVCARRRAPAAGSARTTFLFHRAGPAPARLIPPNSKRILRPFCFIQAWR